MQSCVTLWKAKIHLFNQNVKMNLKCLTIMYKLAVWALKSMISCDLKAKHRALYHTIESIIALWVTNYHCSLLSWNHLQASGQAAHSQCSIPDCESSGTSPGRIKRARENTDHWVSRMTNGLQEIIRLQWEDATIRPHLVWQREKKRDGGSLQMSAL